MHLIMSFLLMLALLTPTSATAQSTTLSNFVRIDRDSKGAPAALQTAVAKYVPASGVKGVEIDLVAVIHVGERSYYQHLNKAFEQYDVVLYELVAPEGSRPRRDSEPQFGNPLALMQQLMKWGLRLEHQLEAVHYDKLNFVHADLSVEGMRKAIRDRGESEMTVFMSMIGELMQKMQQGAGKPGPQNPTVTIEDLMRPTALKRLMAEQLASAGGDVGFGKTVMRSLIDDRNAACMQVLARQLAAGKKKIAIFYGAAHMPDFDKRLRETHGLRRVSDEWINAWNLADSL